MEHRRLRHHPAADHLSNTSTYGRALLVGFLNTLIIAVLGIVAATILGFVIGIMRLSRNFVISGVATAYVETIRNIPLLLQIFVWYATVLKPLPAPREAIALGLPLPSTGFPVFVPLLLLAIYGYIQVFRKVANGFIRVAATVAIFVAYYLISRLTEVSFGPVFSVYSLGGWLSNRGLMVPRPIYEPAAVAILIAFVGAIIAAIVISRWARKRQEATGKQFPATLVSIGLILGLPIIAAVVTGMPVSFELPELKGFNFAGGFTVTPEFLALFLALSIYTSTFIAEIVRGGILAVSHGQTEAARAVGLKPTATLRLVVIPQAMRVIIPPLTSQYLNLTKNSSLAVAIGYPDLVAVGRHGPEPDGQSHRDRHHLDGRLSEPQPPHLGGDELVQCARAPGGALRMASANNEVAFVRTADAPVLPPPPNVIGVNGWLLQNLVSSWWVALLAGLFAVLAGTIIWDVIKWAIIDSVWVAENREGCIAPLAEGKPLGACWAYVKAKLPQWIYGFYPIELRWRPAIVFLLFVALLVPLLIPRVPYKGLNAGLLFVAFPILSFYLLYGTPIPHAALGFTIWLVSTLFWFVGSLVAAIGFIFDTVLAFLNAGSAFSTVMSYVAFPFRWISEALDALLGFATARLGIPGVFWLDYLLTSALILGFLAARPAAQTPGWRGSLVKGAVTIVAIGVFIRLVNIDEGLTVVDTGEWGGLLVTLIVAVTGIVASLPIGIMLALGRRSKMPAVRLLSVAFIELVRGVPLITVLFMASVMLPLFLPAGTNFNKLLRALVGVALFSSAYMAEVVRGGLQAIPRGQYEAAQALGLTYWKMMVLIVLPQALRIVIPGIVNSFISLFKDTTLVSIVGIFDLLGIVQVGFVDQKWVSATTPATGYFAVAAIYWAFCFSMSRYSLYMERRLATGYRR